MKKKPFKPLTAEVVTEAVVLQPVDEARIMQTASSVSRSASSNVRCLRRLLNRPTKSAVLQGVTLQHKKASATALSGLIGTPIPSVIVADASLFFHTAKREPGRGRPFSAENR